MSRKIRSGALLAMLVATLLAPAAGARASEAPLSSTLDLVVLVDRHQSMRPPDPAALAAFLGGVRERHRVAFVGFAERGDVLRALTPIVSGQARTTAYDVRGKLAFDAPRSDLIAGLESALELLKTRRTDQPKRAVIVLGSGADETRDPPDGGIDDRASRLLERFLLEEVVISAAVIGERCGAFTSRFAAGTGGRCLPVGAGDPAGDALGLIYDSLQLRAIELGATSTGAPAAASGEDYSFLDEQKTIKEIGEEAEERAAQPVPTATGTSPLLTALVVVALLLCLGVAALVFTMRQKLLAVLELHGDLEAISKDRSSPSFNRLSLGMTQFNKLFDEAERKLQALSLDLEDYGIESWEIEKRLLDNYLSIADSLFLLVDHLEVQTRSGEASSETEWFRRRLRQLLDDENIKAIAVEPGDAFDNRRHASVGERDDSAPAGTVLEVSRPGYVKRQGAGEDELILRQAEVIISRGVAAAGVDPTREG